MVCIIYFFSSSPFHSDITNSRHTSSTISLYCNVTLLCLFSTFCHRISPLCVHVQSLVFFCPPPPCYSLCCQIEMKIFQTQFLIILPSFVLFCGANGQEKSLVLWLCNKKCIQERWPTATNFFLSARSLPQSNILNHFCDMDNFCVGCVCVFASDMNSNFEEENCSKLFSSLFERIWLSLSLSFSLFF